MSRITIDIAEDEFEFIKAAIEFKTLALTTYMDRCKEFAQQQTQPEFPVQAPVRRGRPPAKKRGRK